MTNFIYNMQDELFHLNMILPVGEFSTIKKLVDHIEAQGKQLRELNMTIEKKNKTIENYEREKESWRRANSNLFKKVQELEEGIRNSEDLTWKQKYDALLHSSEQAIGALQKKCQDYKNSESDATISAIKTLAKENNELEEKNKKLEHNYNELINQRNVLVDENKKLERSNLDLGDTIGLYVEEFKKLKEENKTIEKRCNDTEKALENEKKVSKDLDVTINSKNKLLDEYTTKCNNLERENKELKEKVNLYIGLCNTKHEEVKALAKAVRCPWGDNAEIISVKTARIKELKRQLEDEKQVSKDLNVIINSKNKLLDEYMTKYNNLERNYKKLKKSVNSEYGVASRKKDYSISYLENRIKTLEEENDNLNKAAETLKKIIDLIYGKE